LNARCRRAIWLLLSAAMTPLVVGCGDAAPPSIGFVQFNDGEPVRSGSIEFRSLANGSRYAGRIGPDGSFSLTDQAGDSAFPPGDYEIVVVQIVLTEDLAADDHQHGRTVPRRYADYSTSELRFSNQVARTAPILIELQPGI